MTPAIHGALLGAGMSTITLSFDGLATAYNWLRGDNQSFDRAVKALDLITSSPHLIYGVVTCVIPFGNTNPSM